MRFKDLKIGDKFSYLYRDTGETYTKDNDCNAVSESNKNYYFQNNDTVRFIETPQKEDKPTSLDILLHTISLQIALCHKLAHEQELHKTVGHENIKKDFIEAYANIRRHINTDGDSRFGATYAHNLMQKGEI